MNITQTKNVTQHRLKINTLDMLKMKTLYLPIITSITQKTGGWWGVRYPPFKGGVMRN